MQNTTSLLLQSTHPFDLSSQCTTSIPTDPVADLQRRFATCWADTRTAPQIWAQLAQHYTEPWRAYHNLEHIRDCIEWLDCYQRAVADSIAEREANLAIFFHDAVLTAGRPDNEQRSADWFDVCAQRGGLPLRVRRQVAELILSTAHGADVATGAPLGHGLRDLVHDVDLAILGAPPERYRRYAEAVAEEFRALPRWVFRRGRARWLRRTLEKPRLYALPYFADRLQEAARANLRWELRARTRNGRLS